MKVDILTASQTKRTHVKTFVRSKIFVRLKRQMFRLKSKMLAHQIWTFRSFPFVSPVRWSTPVTENFIVNEPIQEKQYKKIWQARNVVHPLSWGGGVHNNFFVRFILVNKIWFQPFWINLNKMVSQCAIPREDFQDPGKTTRGLARSCQDLRNARVELARTWKRSRGNPRSGKSWRVFPRYFAN